MSNDSIASSNDFKNQVSRKMIKENFWLKKNKTGKIKAENSIRGRQKSLRNLHISYLQEEVKCSSEFVEVEGCNNSPLCNDETLKQFWDFDAADGDASQITLKSIGGHVIQIAAVASMGAIDTIFYAPTA